MARFSRKKFRGPYSLDPGERRPPFPSFFTPPDSLFREIEKSAAGGERTARSGARGQAARLSGRVIPCCGGGPGKKLAHHATSGQSGGTARDSPAATRARACHGSSALGRRQGGPRPRGPASPRRARVGRWFGKNGSTVE